MEKRQESVGENTRQYDARGNQRENPLCPEDYYPVYWGYYEYDNETRESHYDLEIDVKNNKRVKGFIHKWVEQPRWNSFKIRCKKKTKKISHTINYLKLSSISTTV